VASLILIRHAHPEVDPDKPASSWNLSSAGRQGAQNLAGKLSDAGVSRIFTSEEPKSVQTGEIIARKLALSVKQAEGLREHDRSGVGYLANDAFQHAVRDLFENPVELVFGAESAQTATERFSATIDEIERELNDPEATYACVSHGTVMSLFAAT
jgi:broad specificity phosphatase PhoE